MALWIYLIYSVLVTLFQVIQPNELTISPYCVSCLGRVKAIDGCYNSVSYGDFCGPFYMSTGFFEDCTKRGDFVPPPELNSFKECALNYKCAAGCTEAYHNLYAQTCLGSKQTAGLGNELTCADFGKTHVGGPYQCGKEDPPGYVIEYLKNMTDVCGCKTVYGKCPDTVTSNPHVNTVKPLTIEQYILYIVPAVCAVILIILIAVCSIYIYRHKQGAGSRPDTNTDEPGETISPSAIIRIKNEEKPAILMERTVSVNEYSTNPKNEANDKPKFDPTYITVTSEDGNSPTVYRATYIEPSSVQQNELMYDQALPIANGQVSDSEPEKEPEYANTYLPAASDYVAMNGKQKGSQDAGPERADPDNGYINRSMISSLDLSPANNSTPNRGRTPLPLPREPTPKAHPTLDNTPSALYVADIAVDSEHDY